MLAELAALPGYDVIITSHGPTWRFEAIRHRDGGPGPWCVITSDPGDLWWHLARRLRLVDTARASPGAATQVSAKLGRCQVQVLGSVLWFLPWRLGRR